MAFIIGGDPREEKQQPVAVPESEAKRDVKEAQSEKPEAETPRKAVRNRKNGKK